MDSPEFTGERMIPDACRGDGIELEHFARYRFAARFAAGRRVLDAATGAGYGAALLADAGAARVVGIDSDAAAIAYASRRYARPNADFRVDDVRRLATVPDGSCDLYVCFETIEHVEEDADVVRQAARVLAPEGILLLSTPNRDVSRCQNPFHKREYRAGELHDLLRSEFPHVVVLRQRTRFASLIAPPDAGTAGGSAAAAEVTGAADGDASGAAAAPYFVAVASRRAEAVPRALVYLGEAADAEANHRHIQRLEGGVAERDAKIRDLEIAFDRRETRIALRLVHALIRVNRLLGRVPSRAARSLIRSRRVATGAAPPPPGAGAGPLFSVVVPVYENAAFLPASIESALGQRCDDFEVVLYDDASPDPRVRELLTRYEGRPGVKVRFGERNLGISAATNAAIAEASGRYVAFLDCDDLLEPDALARVARRLEREPDAEFLYTNRVDIDDAGKILERWDFTNRSLGRPEQELLLGMFASHLKVIRRDAFRKAGLFRGEFDTVQDYDLALRLAECCRVAFLPEAVYRHRVHPEQATQTGFERQRALAERAKERALLRRRIAAGGYEGLVSIVILSLNRAEETGRCLDAIARHTPFRHEIVLVDNASQPAERARLREITAGRERVTLHELPANLGVGGGRNHGAGLARGDYLVFLDNDITVEAGWLAHLLTEMEGDRRLAACCCRVVFPDGSVQFTGGGMKTGAQRVRFELLHTGKSREDLSTLERRECDWVPGGATIFRKSVFDAIPYDTSLEGAYEDNDWSIATRRAGHVLGNAPLATVVHHHMNFSAAARDDAHYRSQRYDKGKLERTLLRFHAKHGLFIDEEDLYRYLGYAGSEAFIRKATGGRGDPA